MTRNNERRPTVSIGAAIVRGKTVPPHGPCKESSRSDQNDPRRISYQNLEQRRSQFRNFGKGQGRFWMDPVGGGLKINCQNRKILLAMRIKFDRNHDGGGPLGPVSRNYVGKNSLVCTHFEWVVRPALRGCCLSFQRNSGKHTADPQYTGCGRGYDHATCGNVQLDFDSKYHEGDNPAGRDDCHRYWGAESHSERCHHRQG